jgi:hypothetical protein
LKILASPSILAKILTGDAALGFSSLLAGVGPKKIQNPFPSGQYPTSPTSQSI